MGTVKLGSAGVRIELSDQSGYEIIDNPSAIAGVVGFSPKGELNKIITLANTAKQDAYLGYGYQLAKYNQGMYAARAVLAAGGQVEFVRPYGEEIDKSDPYKRDLKTDAFVVTYDRNAYRDDYPYDHTSFNIKHFAATRYKTDAAAEFGITRKINNIAETVSTGKNIDFTVNAGSEFKDSAACRWYDSSHKKQATDVVMFSIMNTDPSSSNRAYTAYEVTDVEHSAGSTALICTVSSKPGFAVGDTVYLPMSNGGSSSMFAQATVIDIIDYEVTLDVVTENYFITGNQKPNTIIYCDSENAIDDGYDYLNVRTAVAGRGVKTFTAATIGDYKSNTAYDPTTSVRHGQFIEVFDSSKQSMLIRFTNNKFVETNKVYSCEDISGTEDMYTISLHDGEGNVNSIIVGDTLSVIVPSGTTSKQINFVVTSVDQKLEKVTVQCSNNSEFVSIASYKTAIVGQKITNQLQDNDAILSTDISAITSWAEFGAAVVTKLKDDSIGYTNNLVAHDINSFVASGSTYIIKVDPSAAYEYAIGDTVAVVIGGGTFDTSASQERGTTKFKSTLAVTDDNPSIITATIGGLNVMSGEITLVAQSYVNEALAKLPAVAYTPTTTIKVGTAEKTCVVYTTTENETVYKDTTTGDVYVYDETTSSYTAYTGSMTNATLTTVPYVYQLIDLTESNMTAYSAAITDSWSVSESVDGTTTTNLLGTPTEYSSTTVLYDKITAVKAFISKWTDDNGTCFIDAGDNIIMEYPEYASAKVMKAIVSKSGESDVEVFVGVDSTGSAVYYKADTGAAYTVPTGATVGTAYTETVSGCAIYTVTVDSTDLTRYLYTFTPSGSTSAVSLLLDSDGYVIGTKAPTGGTQKLVSVAFTVSNVDSTSNIITGKAIVNNTMKLQDGDVVNLSLEKTFTVDYSNLYVIGSYNMFVSSSEQDRIQILNSEGTGGDDKAGEANTSDTISIYPGVHTATTITAIAARSSKVLADSNIGQSFLGLGLAKTSYEDVNFTGEAQQVYVLTDEGATVARIYLGVTYVFNGNTYDFEGTVVPYTVNDTQLSIVQAADYALTGSGAKFVINESGVLDAFLDNNAYDLSQTVVDDVLNGSISGISFNVDDPAIKNDAVWKYETSNNNSGSTLSTVWSLFLDKDASDVDFVVSAGTCINNLFMTKLETINTQVVQAILNLCQSRKDCFALLDGIGEENIEKALKKYNNAVSFTAELGRWGAMYDGRGIVFDSYYTHDNVDICKSIQMASLVTANRAGGIFWYPPAGEKKGKVPSAWGTSEKYPRRYINAEDTTSDIARLSNIHVNPTRTNKKGTFFYGDFTLQQEDTALNQIHAIMLIAGVHKMFYKYLDGKVFQLNTVELRQDIQSTLQKKLDSITSSKPAGFYEAICVCDSTNNTAEIIDQNKLYVDLRMRITKSTRYIYLRSTVLPTSDGNQVSVDLQ